MKLFWKFIILIFALVLSQPSFATEPEPSHKISEDTVSNTGSTTISKGTTAKPSSHKGKKSHTHAMMMFVLQIGIILFAARAGGLLFKLLNLPSVLGELMSGIIIGPYLLGGIPFARFDHGVFPLSGDSIPISMELYGISTIASIILLFMAGLETNLKLFIKFSFAGSVVGVGGVIFSFVIGALTASELLNISFMHPQALFLGVISTATSVGITVRILYDKKKLDTPEGVTILAGAVIDDILGIILVAIVISLSALEGGSDNPDFGAIGMIALKAISVWLGFTVFGLMFAEKIAKLLKINSSVQIISIMSLALALIMAGLFEQAGLAMIIGAYVMGLILSKTDLHLTIEENLKPLHSFFVPIFFTTMGMLVNIRTIFTKEALVIGGIYTIGAVVAKLIGSGVPSLFLNFNKLGALRIGLGMIPRGEVALIVSGVGLASGIIDEALFSISVVMILATTLIAPVFLSKALSIKGSGTRKEVILSETVPLIYTFPDNEMADLIEHKLLQGFLQEEFIVHSHDDDEDLYHIQKGQSLILLRREGESIKFDSPLDQQIFIESLLFEMLVELTSAVSKLKELVKPENFKQSITEQFHQNESYVNYKFKNLFQPKCIKMELESTSKQGIITELVELLYNNKIIEDIDSTVQAVMDREKSLSTGMQNGLAIPHGRIPQVDKLHVAIGFSRDGVDFNSLDNKPSKVFILTVVPLNKKVPYIQFLASVASLFKDENSVEQLCSKKDSDEIIRFFTKK
ncbi:MAG: cation:proton antiporter [Deltaproteobacteria bacterium]|nr:cation:proton antiporter [Deltaproteobacteria bacterium]